MCLLSVHAELYTLFLHMPLLEGRRWLDLVRSYVVDIREAKVDIDPPNLLSQASIVVSVTVPGVKVGDSILTVCKPTLSSKVFVAHGVVTAADTVDVLFVNANTIPVNDPEEEYVITYIKNTKA